MKQIPIECKIVSQRVSPIKQGYEKIYELCTVG